MQEIYNQQLAMRNDTLDSLTYLQTEIKSSLNDLYRSISEDIEKINQDIKYQTLLNARKDDIEYEFKKINIRLRQICDIVGGPTLWKEDLERGPKEFTLMDRQ